MMSVPEISDRNMAFYVRPAPMHEYPGNNVRVPLKFDGTVQTLTTRRKSH